MVDLLVKNVFDEIKKKTVLSSWFLYAIWRVKSGVERIE
jgi:hypothetical protein